MSGGEGEMDGDNINVVIRVRPLNQKEQKVITIAFINEPTSLSIANADSSVYRNTLKSLVMDQS